MVKIAIDIDDVLAATTRVLINEVNQKRGVSLTEAHYRVEADYWGYYEKVWAHHNIDDTDLMKEFHDGLMVDQGHVEPITGSQEAVAFLKTTHELVAITSRPHDMYDATKAWLAQYYGKQAFLHITCLDFKERAAMTKGEACAELGAAWLIDDNIEHCVSAKAQGVQPIIFGAYGWQGAATRDLERCRTWREVEEYFRNV